MPPSLPPRKRSPACTPDRQPPVCRGPANLSRCAAALADYRPTRPATAARVNVRPGRCVGAAEQADRRVWAEGSYVADLPEAVLADNLAVGPERPQVAAAHIDLLPVHGDPADRPLRHTAGTADEVIAIAVVNVRNAFEACRESAAYLILPGKTASPAVRAAGDSNTQSSAKCDMIASRSRLLKPSSI